MFCNEFARLPKYQILLQKPGKYLRIVRNVRPYQCHMIQEKILLIKKESPSNCFFSVFFITSHYWVRNKTYLYEKAPFACQTRQIFVTCLRQDRTILSDNWIIQQLTGELLQNLAHITNRKSNQICATMRRKQIAWQKPSCSFSLKILSVSEIL